MGKKHFENPIRHTGEELLRVAALAEQMEIAAGSVRQYSDEQIAEILNRHDDADQRVVSCLAIAAATYARAAAAFAAISALYTEREAKLLGRVKRDRSTNAEL